MAFEFKNWQPAASQRGGIAISCYTTVDTLAEVTTANYFSDVRVGQDDPEGANDVRSYIQKQRQADDRGIPVYVQCGAAGAFDVAIIELLLNDTTGAITAGPASTRLT